MRPVATIHRDEEAVTSPAKLAALAWFGNELLERGLFRSLSKYERHSGGCEALVRLSLDIEGNADPEVVSNYLRSIAAGVTLLPVVGITPDRTHEFTAVVHAVATRWDGAERQFATMGSASGSSKALDVNDSGRGASQARAYRHAFEQLLSEMESEAAFFRTSPADCK